MKTVRTITINVTSPDDRYSYDRVSTLKLSQEHFSDKEIAKLQGKFIALAAPKGFNIETSQSEKEIPSDEEESFKVKAEKSAESASKANTLAYERQKEIDKLKAENETLKSICPTSHIPAEETEEEDV